ncbi:BglG family transcription antiterminator [Faecalicoccus pleomorphus]|uniref:BglG family transcription antiterminator n=1 Tax=Faecalicoccus pleomorphus TaxID=1323 RepID=UPI003DA3AAFC
MLNQREIKIIKFLENKNEYVSGKELATFLEISSKTLRNDIHILNRTLITFGATISGIKGKGYRLIINDLEQFSSFKDGLIADQINSSIMIPTSHEGRVNYIILKLLHKELDNHQIVTQGVLCESLYIGLTTLKQDMADVRKILSSFNLSIVKDGIKGIRIQGKEEDIRKALHYYISREKEGFLIDFKSIIPFFGEEETTLADQILRSCLERHQLTITDIGYVNLLMHILISIQRVRSKNLISVVEHDESLFETKENHVAKDIKRDIENALKIELPDEEVYYITIHLLTRKVSIMNLDEKISMNQDYQDIVKKTLVYLKEKLDLDFCRDSILVNSLTVHLQSALNRIRFVMNVSNALLVDIQKNYSFAYKIASVASQYIEEQLTVKVNDDEIGYIALHFGAALERMKTPYENEKLRAIIVCASGLGTAVLLSAKIKSHFSQWVGVTQVISLNELKNVDRESFDVVFSTVDIDSKEYGLLGKQVLRIPVILSTKDIKYVEEQILKDRKTYLDFLKYTDEKLFFNNTNFSTRQEALGFILDNMVKNEYLNREDIEKFYKRENISSTEIGNLTAIPHAIELDPPISKVAILINDKPFLWEREKVRLVILLSIRKELFKDFETIFEGMYEILSDESTVFSILKVKTYQEFIRLLR